jgi:signal transduction histidine kinase
MSDYPHCGGITSETRVIELLARGVQSSGVLNELCAFVDAQVGTLSSVLLLDAGGKRLRWVAGPGLPKAFNEAIREIECGSWASSGGLAAYRGIPPITFEIGTDPLFRPLHRLALREGVRTTWSAPLFSTTEAPMGMFSTFYSEKRVFSPEQAELLTRAAHLATISICRDRREEELREASRQLSQSQDEERRRIARELHDSSGQDLAALAITLHLIGAEADVLPEKIAGMLRQCSELTRKVSEEIRTLSYLLHPPLLDECGLATAIRLYVAGINQRHGLHVDLEIPQQMRRLRPESELALFRVVQASLSNVHLHSGSSTALVQIRESPEGTTVMIRDQGKGIPAEMLQGQSRKHGAGIGIAGMRERLEQIGGSLIIDSTHGGTVIQAAVPWNVPWNDLWAAPSNLPWDAAPSPLDEIA